MVPWRYFESMKLWLNTIAKMNSRRNLPSPSTATQPARWQRAASHAVPGAALGRAMRPNDSYDCNRSFRHKVKSQEQRTQINAI
jgi:hypothetical protein